MMPSSQPYPEMPIYPDEDKSEGCLKLFVGGLNYLSMQADLRSYFETFGKVQSCTLLTDKPTGKSKGFAFVILEDPDNILQEKISLDIVIYQYIARNLDSYISKIIH